MVCLLKMGGKGEHEASDPPTPDYRTEKTGLITLKKKGLGKGVGPLSRILRRPFQAILDLETGVTRAR